MTDLEKEKQKSKFKEALSILKFPQNVKLAEEKLDSQVGFKNQKDFFLQNISFYNMHQGRFRPISEVICYSGPPGVGKTTFVQTLSQALEREPLININLAGVSQSPNYSILGDEKKPSLIAWAIKESGCKNPIILLDELEKVTDGKVQADLIKIFEKLTEKDSEKWKFYDPYFQEWIDLVHVSFFATVNYPEKLATSLKDKVKMERLEGYSEEDKKEILQKKVIEIGKVYKLEEKIKKIIPNETIDFLVKEWIQERGVRKLQQALYKITEEYVDSQQINQTPFKGDQRQWIKSNILPFQERFKPSWYHHLLFTSLAINLFLLIIWTFQTFLRKDFGEKKKGHE